MKSYQRQPNSAEVLAERIRVYLETHPNVTQIQLQFALDFLNSDWTAAIRILQKQGAVERTRAGRSAEPNTYRLAK